MSDQRINYWEYWGQYCPRCNHDGKSIQEDPCYHCSPSNLEAVFEEMIEEQDGGFVVSDPDPERLSAPTKFEYWEAS